MSTEAEFLTTYERIKDASIIVMRQIDVAINHEEHNREQEAIDEYESVLQQIGDIFAIPVGLPNNIDAVEPEWNEACTIIQKLQTAKTEVLHRLKVLHTQCASLVKNAVEATSEANDAAADDNSEPAIKKRSVLAENPATYEYYGISTARGFTKTYKEIINALRQIIAGTKESDVHFDTLFQANAKLYKIESDGVVSTMTGNTAMSLVMCTVSGEFAYLNGICFIQCSIPNETVKKPDDSVTNNEAAQLIWIYPLIPAVTHCYRTDYGALILPDMESDVIGSAFGLMLAETVTDGDDTLTADEAEEKLSDLKQFLLDLLEAVLSCTVELLEQTEVIRSPRDTSQQVSRHIISAADFIAHNLVRGAEKTGDLMIKSTPYIMSKLRPAPADAPPVSSSVQTTVEVAKNLTSVAAGATGWVAGKVGAASMYIGRFLAPHIQTQGSALLQKGFGYDSQEACSKMEGALTIAAGAVEGFSTVYNGLETSAKILGNCLSDNSVKIIEHKYGPSAGNVAAGTFDTLGNAFNVSQNVNYITPKGLARKMAKNTGKAVVDDYKRSLREESHIVPAVALYPDLRALKEKKTV